jgi:hypothetical protein
MKNSVTPLGSHNFSDLARFIPKFTRKRLVIAPTGSLCHQTRPAGIGRVRPSEGLHWPACVRSYRGRFRQHARPRMEFWPA